MRAIVFALFASALAMSDCSDGETAPPAIGDRIEQAFPGHAAQIIGGTGRPSRTTRGLELDVRGQAGRPEAILPERAGDPMFIHAPGLDVSVREIGARGTAAIAGSAIAYDAADAHASASLWAATPNGCEEWLLVPDGMAGEVATFEIDGARAVLREDVVLLLDAVGAPRVVVSAPSAFAAGGKAIGVHLGVRGDRVVVSIDAHEGAALVDPAWVAAASMASARMRHTATLLLNGKVLVVGGVGAAGELATAEIYDPSVDMWSPAAAMTNARAWHESVLLANGKVLAMGGEKGGTALATAEIYDPALDLWSPATSMATARFRFSTTVLQSGAVLAVGGFTSAATTGSAELYAPATDTWSPAAGLAARGAHRATLLQNGKVLVSGGLFVSGVVTSTLADAWLFDPVASTWSAAASLAAARFDHTATLLATGRVFVAGGSQSDGFTTSNLSSAERYDSGGDAWSSAGTLSAQRAEHVAALLTTGGVVVAGGDANGATADLYDPIANTLAPTTAMTQKRLFATATPLPNGKAVIIGGEAASVLASSEIYTPPAAAGVACALPTDCVSGFCVSAVCCATACAGACQACSIAAGAAANGVCAPISGVACDDGNACTTGDACTAGVCSAGVATVCMPSDGCHAAGACNPLTGVCGAGMAVADKTACDDKNACTTGDVCTGGVCAGPTLKICPPAVDQCHADGACDPASGLCVSMPLMDGTACEDGDPCTNNDSCGGGVCAGEDAQCSAIDDCHEAGVCDSATGLCSNPIKEDGASCEGGTCAGGACIAPPTTSAEMMDMPSGAGGAGGDDGTGGSGGAGGSADDETASTTGCGCVVAGDRESGTALGIGALLMIAALRRRRRARR